MAEKEGVLAAITVRIRDIMVATGCQKQRDLEAIILRAFGVSQSSERHATLRRRIYDALSTFIALGLITKSDKSLYWNGFPGVEGYLDSSAREAGTPLSDSSDSLLSSENSEGHERTPSERPETPGNHSGKSVGPPDSGAQQDPWDISDHGHNSAPDNSSFSAIRIPEGLLPPEEVERIQKMSQKEAEEYVAACDREFQGLRKELADSEATIKELEEKRNYYALFTKFSDQEPPRMSTHFLRSREDTQNVALPFYVIALRSGRDARVVAPGSESGGARKQRPVAKQGPTSLAMLLQARYTTILSSDQLTREAVQAPMLQGLPTEM